MKYIYTKDIIEQEINDFISFFKDEEVVTNFYNFSTEPYIRDELLHSYSASATIVILRNNLNDNVDCYKIDEETISVKMSDKSNVNAEEEIMQIMSECGWIAIDNNITFKPFVR